MIWLKMNIKDQLYQEKKEQELSFQQIGRLTKPRISAEKVKAVFEDDPPIKRDLNNVCTVLGVEEDYWPPVKKTRLLSLENRPNTEGRREPQTQAENKGMPRKANKKTLALANGESCVRCGVNDGTICSCHYTGFRQHELGKGYGMKCNDLATAFLCHKCHTEMDQPKERKSVEASEDFLFCVIKTIIRKEENGNL